MVCRVSYHLFSKNDDGYVTEICESVNRSNLRDIMLFLVIATITDCYFSLFLCCSYISEVHWKRIIVEHARLLKGVVG